MSKRCKGRETGCAGTTAGESRCPNCRAIHNARETARRRARRRECGCWVCGATAAKVDGVYQATCAAHEHYRTEMRQKTG